MDFVHEGGEIEGNLIWRSVKGERKKRSAYS